MGLIDLDNLKPYYDSDRDDVLNDFYIPVLKESVDYWRLAGFFSSTALAVASRGIKGLLNNNGRIKLIAGAIVHPEDVVAIREGIENPLEVIERNAVENLNSIREEFIRNHVRALGWLVARNRLDIRMAIVKDNDGLPLDSISINKNGIFHQKVGIFTDAQGQKISFSGSINETKMAWCNNIEEFKVFREWANGEKAHFQSDQDRFIKYWSGESSRVQIMEMPEVIRKNLIRMAPEDIRTIDLSYPPRSLIKRLDNTMNYKYNDKINNDINNLRDYQCTAIKKWKENRYKGILEMATASGKTFTAIIGSYCLYKEIKKLCTIVLVPSRPLVAQWGIEIRKYSDNVVMVSSEIKNWKAMIQDLIYLFNTGYIDHFYVVSTIQSYMGNLSNYLSHISSEHILLVADEAHWLGASQAKSFMGSTSFKYILGLTATPIRHFDEDGTQFLKSFFGGVIFEFDIKNGQERGYLCNYNYHIKFCNLDSEELEEYISLTKNIVRSVHNLKKNDDEKKITRLLNKRATIVKDAESKFKVFDDLLNEFENKIEGCVIYCDGDQIDKICSILRSHDIIFRSFLEDTSEDERQLIISDIKSGVIDAVVAIKCLNEGVDIPPLRIGFFLSSSSNPREFIQRRGRLLRKCNGKNAVDIYDFIVTPNLGKIRVSEQEMENIARIIRKELERVKEFNDTALNRTENEISILKELDLVIY